VFKCKICGKEFDNRASFGGHMSGHKRFGKSTKDKSPIIRNRICLYCGKEFVRTRGKFCSHECSVAYVRNNTYYKGMDITNADLLSYRAMHRVCEICGRPESLEIRGQKYSLAADHDHKTNHFRGLLCYSCNTKLSWYENWKDNIENYLAKP
jgi:ribosomal protein L32